MNTAEQEKTKQKAERIAISIEKVSMSLEDRTKDLMLRAKGHPQYREVLKLLKQSAEYNKEAKKYSSQSVRNITNNSGAPVSRLTAKILAIYLFCTAVFSLFGFIVSLPTFIMAGTVALPALLVYGALTALAWFICMKLFKIFKGYSTNFDNMDPAERIATVEKLNSKGSVHIALAKKLNARAEQAVRNPTDSLKYISNYA